MTRATTLGRRDAAAERTWMYSQRVVAALMPARRNVRSWPNLARAEGI